MRALMSLNLHHQQQQQQQQQRLTAGSNLADTANSNAPATVLFSARLLPFRDYHLIIAICNLYLFSRKNGPRRDNGGPRTPTSLSLSLSLRANLTRTSLSIFQFSILVLGYYVSGYEKYESFDGDLIEIERDEKESYGCKDWWILLGSLFIRGGVYNFDLWISLEVLMEEVYPRNSSNRKDRWHKWILFLVLWDNGDR